MLLSFRAGRASKPSASFARLAKYRAHKPQDLPIPYLRRRTYAADANISGQESTSASDELKDPESRFNEIGVQQISHHVYTQVFTDDKPPPSQELIELSKDHLLRHELLGKNTDNTPPISFDLPELQGTTLDEHFYRLGSDASEPYLTHAKQFANTETPQRPREWSHKSGWTRYNGDGSMDAVEAPDEEMLCFDTEVMWKESSFAVMACAVSPTHWYAWLSPWLLGETDNDRQLIPLGDPNTPRIIVGHNIGYDRARVAEEYDIAQSKNYFMDTMSLHVAVNGMCSRQRPTWMKHRKDRELREKIASETDNADLASLLGNKTLSEEEEAELWIGRSSVNSLRDVAKFHLNVTIDKSARNAFGDSDRQGIRAKLDELIDYCAADVDITHRVYKRVFPNFVDTCPHPVSFAALRHLSSVILPVDDKSWESYVANSEATYQKLSDAVQDRLLALKDKVLEIKDDKEIWSTDPWLRQLDWTTQEVRMVKVTKKGELPRQAKGQKMPGFPKWYKDLYPRTAAPINLSVRTRIAPLLLRLAWDGYPLVWSDKYGWTFRVPIEEAHKYTSKQMQECSAFETPDLALRDDTSAVYFKVPHKDGPLAKCGNPMAKSYVQYFELGILSSEYPFAKEALEMNASCSYWISARNRIQSQMTVFERDGAKGPSSPESESETGYILPQIIPMGTVTRRAVENTWLTASNAKKNRVGSELKSMIKAPHGYCFVGADVDSEELWIASLVGDAQFKLHGGNAVGFMTLEGTKAAGTDLHSRTAAILGITRNDAKIFNYGRIYGAGLKFASTLLRQFNPNLSESETTETAGNLYKATKGVKTNRKALNSRAFWRGGTESFVFNKLEEFAEEEKPRTPVLGAGITQALMARYVSKGGFMTSRINWAIQSSGVDYLHLLIISMDYLIRRFNINARLSITVHDEIRYLVKDHDKYRAALALQVSNLWTRAMFSQQMGINDLPQSCAYFSAVDIDHVLRKEVDMDCITPSHATAIPHGESIDIQRLLLEPTALLDPNITPTEPIDLSNILYESRIPVMESLHKSTDLMFLRAQISASDQELKDILKEKRKLDDAKLPQEPKVNRNRNLPYESYAHLMEEPIMVSDALSVGRAFDAAKGKNLPWDVKGKFGGTRSGAGARW
ncbi:DNA polymerase gamma [Sclerotinia borealis F-4128]|uniref:DNA-directed DNA polymerase n=1 Tax=Sclerotinia borealis (strain F-4128) TaxID=1432307 RepID=W9CEI0_SCLBF|nr:DNA polymerase gamma [Sclerotinia borealis F-4128]